MLVHPQLAAGLLKRVYLRTRRLLRGLAPSEAPHVARGGSEASSEKGSEYSTRREQQLLSGFVPLGVWCRGQTNEALLGDRAIVQTRGEGKPLKLVPVGTTNEVFSTKWFC